MKYHEYLPARPTWEDKILWPIIKFFWEPFSKKQSHWWHWKSYTGTIDFPLFVEGYKQARLNYGSLWKNLFQTNFKWDQCVIVQPKDFTGMYRRGFRHPGEKDKGIICEVLLVGPHAALIGPHDAEFFALSYPENKSIELEMVTLTSKYKLDKEIFLT